MDTGIPINYDELTNGVGSSRKTLPFYGRYDTTSLKKFYTFDTDPTGSFNPSGDEDPTTYYISIEDYNMVKYFGSGSGSNSGAVRFMSIFPTYQSTDSDFESRKNHFTLAFLVLPNNEGYSLGKDQIKVYSDLYYEGNTREVDDARPEHLAFNFAHRGTPSKKFEDNAVSLRESDYNGKNFLYNFAGYDALPSFERVNPDNSPLKDFAIMYRKSFEKDRDLENDYSYHSYFKNFLPYSSTEAVADPMGEPKERHYLVKQYTTLPEVDGTKKELVFKTDIFRAVKPSLTVKFGHSFYNVDDYSIPQIEGKKEFYLFKTEKYSSDDVSRSKQLNNHYSVPFGTDYLRSSTTSPYYRDRSITFPLPYLSFDDAYDIHKAVWDETFSSLNVVEFDNIIRLESFVDPDTNEKISSDNGYKAQQPGYRYIFEKEYKFDPNTDRMEWVITIHKVEVRNYKIYSKWISKGNKHPSHIELKSDAQSNQAINKNTYISNDRSSNYKIEKKDEKRFLENFEIEPSPFYDSFYITPLRIGSDTIGSSVKYDIIKADSSSKQEYSTENYRMEVTVDKVDSTTPKELNVILTTIEQVKPEVKVIFQDEKSRPITDIAHLPKDLSVVLSLVNGGSELKSQSFTKADVSSLSSSGEGLKHTFDKMDFDTSYSVKATTNENVFEAAIIDESNKSEHKYTVTFKKKAVAPILPILPSPEPTPTPPVTPTPTPTPDPVSPLPTPAPVLPEPTPIPPVPTIITPEEDIIPLSSVTLVDEPEAEVPVLPDVVIPSDEEIENLDIGLDETPRGSTDIGDDDNPKGNSILAKTGGLMNKFLAAILGLSALLAILFLSFFKKKS